MQERQRAGAVETHGAEQVYDVLGVGFGPANLALLLCLHEQPAMPDGRQLRSLFLERKPDYDWHPDMLIDGASIQVSFLKDLVTLRNPCSHFSFLNYLRLHGRLLDFVNLRTFFPTRVEYNDYFRWVAAQVRDSVHYDREVMAVQAVPAGRQGAPRPADSPAVELLRVVARHGGSGLPQEYLTRNLVVATGGVPYIPAGIDLDAAPHVFHSQSFLRNVRQHFPRADAPYRFVVVGSGQSAAEIFQYLFTQFPRAQVTAAIRRFAYKPADESEFVNEIFSPVMTDVVYGLPPEERRSLRDMHADTNYSAVDLELIRSIYRSIYDRKRDGDTRVQVRAMMELEHVEQHDATVTARFWNKVERRCEHLEADGLVLATGFQHSCLPPVLKELEPYLVTIPGGGEYQVGRDYRVQSVPGFAPAVYLQGYCESTHGLSDTLLSVLPIRSREILESILAGTGGLCSVTPTPVVI